MTLRWPQGNRTEPVENFIFALTFLAALGSGLIAGVFFVFSVAVMRALERTPSGMAAMQSINVVIVNPLFLGVFLGSALLCIAVGIAAIVRWTTPNSTLLIVGALFYLIGSIGVTMIFNVPMNNALAAADDATAEGQKIWTDYVSNWTLWNHVRTFASLAASASFILALAWRA